MSHHSQAARTVAESIASTWTGIDPDEMTQYIQAGFDAWDAYTRGDQESAQTAPYPQSPLRSSLSPGHPALRLGPVRPPVTRLGLIRRTIDEVSAHRAYADVVLDAIVTRIEDYERAESARAYITRLQAGEQS